MSAILTATDLEVRYNDLVVLDKASLAIDESDHIGMVGRNGAGKSTFLKIIAGEMAPDRGQISRRKDAVIGYLPQDFQLDQGLTVSANIRTGAQHILDVIHEFENLAIDSKKHSALEAEIERLDGWNLDTHISTAMDHLNCPAGERVVETLSGGEKRRVALCRAIISRPDLLILDEPTNHLDTESIEWLGDYLENYRGAFLLVTHDRYFLDRITNTIVELSSGKFFSYSGNYTDYLISKAERQSAEELVEHKRQMFLRRELEWVRRGPKARTTKSKSRLQRYFDVAGKDAPEIETVMDLVIPPPPQLGNRIVELADLGMELGGRTLFSGLNFTFASGQRIGITGRNGLGKTSLLKLILGGLSPTSGQVRVGQLTQFNYVDQARVQLREDKTVLEEVSDGTEFVIFGEHRLSLRAYLKRFLFTDDRIATQVKYLSGGERSRLLLARILKNGGNFLILDEPTNDLDLPTLRVLEEALIAFPGVVLVVSHDRYFLNRVCTGIIAFEGGGQVDYSVGDYEYYVEKKAQRQRAANSAAVIETRPSPPVVVSSSPKPASDSKPRKLTFKEDQELKGMEAAIAEAEVEVARVEALFVLPDFHKKHGHRLSELTDELKAQKDYVAGLYARWEHLERIKTEWNR